MLEQGLIVETRERPAPELDDERRRYYRIAPFGTAVARAEARRLTQLVKLARRQRLPAGPGLMRLYRALLHLYPSSFRAEYGAEMCAVFAQRARDASSALRAPGPLGGDPADVSWNAARTHLDILRPGPPVHGSHAGPLARVHGDRDRGGRARRRGDHGDLHDHRPRAHPAAAVPRLRPPRERVAVEPGLHAGGVVAGQLPRLGSTESRSFEAMAAFVPASLNLVGEGDRSGSTARRSRPTCSPCWAPGRSWVASSRDADDLDRRARDPGAPGYGLWQRRFGGDPAVLGRKVLLDDAPYEVIGVMPRAFLFPNRETQASGSPMRFDENDFADRDNNYLRAVARLKHGVPLERARAEMQVVAAQLERAYPKENARQGITIVRTARRGLRAGRASC